MKDVLLQQQLLGGYRSTPTYAYAIVGMVNMLVLGKELLLPEQLQHQLLPEESSPH